MKAMRYALFALALVASVCSANASTQYADKVTVDKSDRKLHVIIDGRIVAIYPIALGGSPVGHKQREGDRKTPEGTYILDFKKADSAYYRAIHISYPNAQDRKRARRQGVPPGGAIMIHGQPNDRALRAALRIYPFRDWTDGCIALSNEDMLALWRVVRVPTPIEIRP